MVAGVDDELDLSGEVDIDFELREGLETADDAEAGYREYLRPLAAEALKMFFDGRRMPFGGLVHERTYLSPAYVDTLIRYHGNFGDALSAAYGALAECDVPIVDLESDATNDIQMILMLREKVGFARVRQEFHGGMLLVALDLLYGVANALPCNASTA